MTQLMSARKGVVTEAMKKVAADSRSEQKVSHYPRSIRSFRPL